MKPFAGIKLPVQETIKVPINSNMDAIDFLLDILFFDKYNYLKIFTCYKKPQFFGTKCVLPINHYPYQYYAYLFIIVYPPLFWCDFRGQKYLLFIGRLIEYVKTYFIYQSRKTLNPIENALFIDILKFLEDQQEYKFDTLIQK